MFFLPSLADIGEEEAGTRPNNDYIVDDDNGDQSSDSSVEMVKVHEKTKEKWDCESILSKFKMLNDFVLAIALQLVETRSMFNRIVSLYFYIFLNRIALVFLHKYPRILLYLIFI